MPLLPCILGAAPFASVSPVSSLLSLAFRNASSRFRMLLIPKQRKEEEGDDEKGEREEGERREKGEREKGEERKERAERKERREEGEREEGEEGEKGEERKEPTTTTTPNRLSCFGPNTKLSCSGR